MDLGDLEDSGSGRSVSASQTLLASALGGVREELRRLGAESGLGRRRGEARDVGREAHASSTSTPKASARKGA